ncbi:MAG: PaaI family thioesterase [Candidatus Hermodarchaeota archaeon]
MRCNNSFEENLVELPNNWPGKCFGCSTKNEYGLHLKVLMSENGCISYTRVPEKFCGFDGIVHGGIIATLLDEISAWTLIVHMKKLCITQEAKIKYYRPVLVNSAISVEGKIKERSEHEVKTISYIKNIKGNLLAESESQWTIPDLETLAKITRNDIGIITNMYNRFIEPIELIQKRGVKDEPWILKQKY